jgi:hypothetical protein
MVPWGTGRSPAAVKVNWQLPAPAANAALPLCPLLAVTVGMQQN